MTKEFLIGMIFGFIGVAGMISCILSKYKQTPDDDYEQTIITEDLEADSDSDEFFDAETGSKSDITERHGAKVLINTQIIEKHDAETECDIQIHKKNENEIMIEQRLKSIEDTLVLLRIEMASMKRCKSRTRVSIQLQPPPMCWAHPMPGSQPVHSVPMSTPPPVHSVPMPPPPPVHSIPIPPPPPPAVTTGFGLPPPPPPPPPAVTTGFGLPPPPPPPPMMTTGDPGFRNNSEITKIKPKKTEYYFPRYAISPELIKTVVLRPPGERIRREQLSTATTFKQV